MNWIMREVADMRDSLKRAIDYMGKLQDENKDLLAENMRLRKWLVEAENELDSYYANEYPSDHPYDVRKLREAMAANPARLALLPSIEPVTVTLPPDAAAPPRCEGG